MSQITINKELTLTTSDVVEISESLFTEIRLLQAQAKLEQIGEVAHIAIALPQNSMEVYKIMAMLDKLTDYLLSHPDRSTLQHFAKLHDLELFKLQYGDLELLESA